MCFTIRTIGCKFSVCSLNARSVCKDEPRVTVDRTILIYNFIVLDMELGWKKTLRRIRFECLMKFERKGIGAEIFPTPNKTVSINRLQETVMFLQKVSKFRLTRSFILGSVSSPLCVWNLGNGMQSNTTVSHEVYWMTINWTTTCFGLYWPSSGCLRGT